MTHFPFIPATPGNGYVGRFAPSPSGHLHFGSMIAAFGSYLQARANNGLWLVRMEDIDPPREMSGAASHILNTLEQHGLHWDGEVVYQSDRSSQYRAVLDWLKQNEQVYLCRCSRKQINQNSQTPGIYARTCRDLGLNEANCALRFKNDQPQTRFVDKLQGTMVVEPLKQADDFIIHRKDGLFAYQLAVVVDDLLQGITEVVRGSDLLTTTLHQMTLFNAFSHAPPTYLHLPVAVTEPGKKLSKQNHAKPVSHDNCRQTLVDVLQFLQFDTPQGLNSEPLQNIIDWAVANWRTDRLPRCAEKILL